MLKNIIGIISVKIIAVFIGVYFQYLMVSEIGSDGLGRIVLSVTVVSFLATISRLGMDHPLLRFSSIAAAENNYRQLYDLYFWPIIIATVVSCVIMVTYMVIGDYILDFFRDVSLGNLLLPSSFLIPCFTIGVLQVQFLQGIRKRISSIWVQQITPYLIPVIFLIFSHQLDSEDVLYLLLIGFIASLLCAHIQIFLFLKGENRKGDGFHFNKLLVSSKHVLLMNIVNDLSVSLNPFFSGLFLTLSDVGEVSVVIRIAVFVSSFLTIINIVTNPIYANFYHKDKLVEMEILAKKVSFVLMLIGVFVFSIFYLFGVDILFIFGEKFALLIDVLLIIAIGELINTASGSVGFLLLMTGHEKDMQFIFLCTFIISIILYLSLTPMLGVTGLAIAYSSTQVIKNIWMSFRVKKHLNFIPFPFIDLVFNKCYKKL